MHHTDARAKNLFARLFSYVPRPISDVAEGQRSRQRNALEDFCTEALAWCLLNSKEFSNRLFALEPFAKLGFRPNVVEVHTQLSVKGENTDDVEAAPIPSPGRFDLVVTSTTPVPFLIVIENKVAPDKSDNINEQLSVYRRHLGGSAFKPYAEKRIILLTPNGATHEAADSSLSWDRIHDTLRDAADASGGSDPEGAVLRQFADFLKLRHLAKMKLPPVASSLSALKNVAPYLAGLDAIFESLRNDESGKATFSPRDVNPKMDHHTYEGEDFFWYGIWSRGSAPIYYVGFHSTCHGDAPLSVSVQVTFQGNRSSEPVPKKLLPWFNQNDSGLEGDQTNFIFTTKIAGSLDGNAAAIEGWVIERLRDVKGWVDSSVG